MQSLSIEQLKVIFTRAGLGEITTIRKIDIGFSNDVYAIDERYMLKIGKSVEDDERLQRDAFLCNLLQKTVPAPRIIVADGSKAIVERFYFIYERIPGENLYSIWHLLDDAARRECIRQICTMLKAINHTPYAEFAARFHIDLMQSWQQRVYARIAGYLAAISDRQTLSPEIIAQTRRFLDQHAGVLLEACLGLTYFDPHFDNFLVSGSRIIGMLDFERIEIASIDYVLDMVTRMAQRPHKYASEATEPFVRTVDYAMLLPWYREFYPELFVFADLEIRLSIYAIEASLQELYYSPSSREARDELVRSVNVAQELEL